MLTAAGAFLLLFGLLGFVGQLVSAVAFPFAQRHGLQEDPEHTDPIYRRLERNTARWDVLVLWTLPVTGVLMLMDHSWWPYLALFAGGVHADAGGRELAKLMGLRRAGVGIGTPKEERTALLFLSFLTAIGVGTALYGLVTLA